MGCGPSPSPTVDGSAQSSASHRQAARNGCVGVMERPPSRPGPCLFLAVGRLSDGYDLRRRYKERLGCLYVVTMGTASGCLRLVVGGSRRTGCGDRGCCAGQLVELWMLGAWLAFRAVPGVPSGRLGRARPCACRRWGAWPGIRFLVVVDVERFGQVQARASDQAVEVVGRPLFPQHRGQGVAVAVGVVSDGLAPRVDYVGVAAGGAAGGRKVRMVLFVQRNPWCAWSPTRWIVSPLAAHLD